MQYMLGFAIIVALVVIGLYKLNNQFEKREFVILIVIIIVMVVGYNFYDSKNANFYPKMFKEHYAKTEGIAIDKLSYTQLNNQQLTSKNKFIYNFTYIIKKKETLYLCEAKKVTITKIEDSYVFNDYEEVCKKK